MATPLRNLRDPHMALAMPSKLADRLSAVAPSATLAMAALAKHLQNQGHRVIQFSLGEPDFDTPLHIRDAGKAALDAGATHYTPVAGIPELRSAICGFVERERGWRPEPSQVVVSCGAKQALFNIAMALFEPGDEVLIPSPYWVSYPEHVRLTGATPVIVKTREDDGFRLRPELLQAALTPKTKAFVLCTPSNPTGAAYSKQDLEALVSVLRNHDCWIIVDEIYAQLIYDDFHHISLPSLAADLRDRIVVVDGASKAYAMTGWRIGWSIAPSGLARAIDLVQGQSTTNAASISQFALLAALGGRRDELITMRDVFSRRRVRLVNGLRNVPGIRCRMPEGAFYAFADVTGLYGLKWDGEEITSDQQVALWLLDKAHVAAVAGTSFGAPGYMRFSYTCSDADIDEGVEAIRKCVESARLE